MPLKIVVASHKKSFGWLKSPPKPSSDTADILGNLATKYLVLWKDHVLEHMLIPLPGVRGHQHAKLWESIPGSLSTKLCSSGQSRLPIPAPLPPVGPLSPKDLLAHCLGSRPLIIPVLIRKCTSGGNGLLLEVAFREGEGVFCLQWFPCL